MCQEDLYLMELVRYIHLNPLRAGIGDARTRDERGLDIEKTEHRVLDGVRIRDERATNRRGARIAAFGRGQIRESEERPLAP